MRRAISYSNSFLPRIHGRIEAQQAGTRISVTMFVHPLVAAAMIFWLAIVGIAMADKHGHASGAWVALAFGLILPVVTFFPEAVKAKHMILEALTRP
jgi:hypothetical protein